MTQYTVLLGNGSGYRCGKYCIRTQDNREDWRCKYWGDYAQRRWHVALQRWRPSILWRFRRLLGVS